MGGNVEHGMTVERLFGLRSDQKIRSKSKERTAFIHTENIRALWIPCRYDGWRCLRRICPKIGDIMDELADAKVVDCRQVSLAGVEPAVNGLCSRMKTL